MKGTAYWKGLHAGFWMIWDLFLGYALLMVRKIYKDLRFYPEVIMGKMMTLTLGLCG